MIKICVMEQFLFSLFPFHLFKFPYIIATTSYCGTTAKRFYGVGMNLFLSMFEPCCMQYSGQNISREAELKGFQLCGGLHVPWEHTCLFCLGIIWLGTETPLST